MVKTIASTTIYQFVRPGADRGINRVEFEELLVGFSGRGQI